MNSRPRLWLLRLGAFAMVVVCGGVAAMLAAHRSSHPIVGPYSLPAAAALMLALMGTALSLGTVILPARLLIRLENWLVVGWQPTRLCLSNGTIAQGITLAALALASYLVGSVTLILANDRPRDDQLDYLRLAIEIRSMGGLPALWTELWAGTYSEENRHPLYPAMLSLCLKSQVSTEGNTYRGEADRSDHTDVGSNRIAAAWGQAFNRSKWLSLWLGLVSLGVIGWGTVRRAGWLVGGVAVLLLATNSVFLESASLVACEILLVAWVLAAWFTVDTQDVRHWLCQCSGSQWVNSSQRIGAAAGSLLWRCVLVGIWLGLAYLTKASALILLFGFVAWGLSVTSLRRCSWLAVVGFILVSSPLLARNVSRFHDPLYSVNTRFLFADSFEQGLQQQFHGNWTGAKNYLGSHTACQIAQRVLSGFGWEGFILLRSLGPAAFGAGRPLAGMVLLMFAFWGASCEKPQWTLLAVIWSGLFFVFFAWYVPIASGDRFLAPVVPVLLIFAARGAVALFAADRAMNPKQTGQRVVWAAALFAAANAVLSYAHWAINGHSRLGI